MNEELEVVKRDNVGIVEIRRPPNNFFDVVLIEAIAEAYEQLDADIECRAIVLCSTGKHFCAGADFSSRGDEKALPEERTRNLYRAAVRLFETRTPVVAAVQGGAIGGGLGLALSADFRVCCPQARFSANFARLGFHPGFGISVTLPRLIGHAQAELMLYTGRRVKGDEAHALGLAEYCVPIDELRGRAISLAQEVAASAPLAVQSIRATQRDGLAAAVAQITEHELKEQVWLRDTEDCLEGIQAMAERRTPVFRGR